MTRTKAWRLSLAAILGFGWIVLTPLNSYATCVSQLQAQTIAAAYEGDTEPTVHYMDTCSGDDLGYQIPIATSITFDGVQYSNVYATTNSVITFGVPDGTYWDYPQTPSISLYSMDWYPGYAGRTEGLDIYYSEGGFQINLNMVPFGNWNAEPSTVNILVAITNTGGISVAYSYQGPQYNNLRTGVRLHDGSIVSLEAWGATQVSPTAAPTLQAEPIVDPASSPTPTPITPEQQQEQIAEAAQLAEEIGDLNNLIAAINGEEVQPDPELPLDPEPTPDPEPSTNPEPDVEVDPEIITPEDPRFPDDEEQTEPDDPNPSPSSDTTDEENVKPTPEPEPSAEPSQEPSPQPEDTDPVQEPEQDLSVDKEVVNLPSDNNNIDNPISEEELNKLNKLIGVNDAKLATELSNTINNLSEEAKKELAADLNIDSKDLEIIAEAVKDNPVLAVAIVEFSSRAEQNLDAPMPYTLADATTEIAAEQFLADPIAALTNIDLSKVLNPSEWGKDMTDDQREKAQEVVIPVILASNIIAAAMTRRT